MLAWTGLFTERVDSVDNGTHDLLTVEALSILPQQTASYLDATKEDPAYSRIGMLSETIPNTTQRRGIPNTTLAAYPTEPYSC
ncbi:MAG: hypothetical protein OSB19_02580 [Opitutaceae bacterium]|nr:hypothetical protein [Opitutaceae bacterium]